MWSIGFPYSPGCTFACACACAMRHLEIAALPALVSFLMSAASSPPVVQRSPWQRWIAVVSECAAWRGACTRQILARVRRMRQRDTLLEGQLAAILEQGVHLRHCLRPLGRLTESHVAAAAAPAGVGQMLSVPKHRDVQEELGRDLATPSQSMQSSGSHIMVLIAGRLGPSTREVPLRSSPQLPSPSK